ncbi:MAG: hypothetical protein QOG37_1322, partial [Mycobacterium sp.]|nr:hypothetical protein [Mycobacterium sp.]
MTPLAFCGVPPAPNALWYQRIVSHPSLLVADLISLWVKPFQYSLEDLSHGGDLVVV